MIDPLPLQLFGQFPREFPTPGRSMVYDAVEFNQHINISTYIDLKYISPVDIDDRYG